MHKFKVTSFKEPDFVWIHSNLEENDGEQFLLCLLYTSDAADE